MERPDHLPLVTVSVLEREHEEMVSDFTFFNFAFWKLLLSKNPRSHGKSSGEVAQYNAQARWRRRWADQSLLCPLNYFFKRVRGQVVFCREASLFVIMMLPVLPFLWYFSMSSEALDSTPRLEVNLDEEGLVHTRALGLALALLSGVLMTVYSRCPRTRLATFMFSELWTCHL